VVATMYLRNVERARKEQDVQRLPHGLRMATTLPKRALATLAVMTLSVASCSEKPNSSGPFATDKGESASVSAGSCQLPPLAVPVGTLLGRDWGKNASGAFPFTQGGAAPAPGNVALTLRMNFKLSGGVLLLTSVTGETPAGDKVFLPALVNSPVTYGPPQGGYTETPKYYRESGCDSLWWGEPFGVGGIATQNLDGSYKAQCATVVMDTIPVVVTQFGQEFSSDFASPELATFADAGNTGWVDPNTGRIMIGSRAYSTVSRGWELAARLQEAGIATFSARQVPWANGSIGRVDGPLVREQIERFGATVSDSGSDYTYRTDGYTRAGKWAFSHGYYSRGIPKSGPGRLSAGVAMFRFQGSLSADRKTVTVKNFSYSGPMLVCPANGQECTASPGRSFTGLSCSFSF